MRGRFEDKRLRDSARGQPCTFRIPNVCCFDPKTTVLCHDRRGHFGGGCKPDDFNAAFGCHTCHDAIDNHRLSADDEAHYWNRAKVATLRNWFARGILCVTDGDETKAGGTA